MGIDKAKIESHFKKAKDLFLGSKCEPTSEFLEVVGSGLYCEWTVYWSVDPIHQSLYAKGIWTLPGVQSDSLRLDTEVRKLSIGEGIPGQVWRSKMPMWSANIDMDMSIPRSLYAHSIGFDSGVWFPIVTAHAVYGVLELLGRKVPTYSEETMAIIENLGRELGRLADGTKKL